MHCVVGTYQQQAISMILQASAICRTRKPVREPAFIIVRPIFRMTEYHASLHLPYPIGMAFQHSRKSVNETYQLGIVSNARLRSDTFHGSSRKSA
jgi:hypothetical protein